jgi:hypothetical protein
MLRTLFAVALAVAAAGLASSVSADDKKDAPKGEVLKVVITATAELSADKKKLTVTAVGQVNTGGWSGAKLTPKPDQKPKDGVYEYELTAIRPTGIVTQALSKVKAEHVWENPPADLKAVKILGADKGAKTVEVK